MIRFDPKRRVFVLSDGYEVGERAYDAACVSLDAETKQPYEHARLIADRKIFRFTDMMEWRR